MRKKSVREMRRFKVRKEEGTLTQNFWQGPARERCCLFYASPHDQTRAQSIPKPHSNANTNAHLQPTGGGVDAGVEDGNLHAASIVLRELLHEIPSLSLLLWQQAQHRKIFLVASASHAAAGVSTRLHNQQHKPKKSYFGVTNIEVSVPVFCFAFGGAPFWFSERFACNE